MKPDLRDVAFIVGGAVLFFGVYQMYPPAAYIITGLVLVVGAVAPFMRKHD